MQHSEPPIPQEPDAETLPAARRFFAALEAHPAAMLLAEPDGGRILLANQAARARYGGALAHLRLPDLASAQVQAAPLELEGQPYILAVLQLPPFGAAQPSAALPAAGGADAGPTAGEGPDAGPTAGEGPDAASLPDADERYRLLIENAGLLMCELDPAGRLTYLNPALLRLTGYEPGELLGRRVLDLIHPDDEALAVRSFDALLADYRPATMAWRFRSRQGGWLWLECWANRYQTLQGEARVGVIIQDITQRQRAEQMLWARVHLREYAAGHSLDELLQQTLEIAEQQTGSQLGFMNLVEAGDEAGGLARMIWSTRTRQKLNPAIPLASHGEAHEWVSLWAEAADRRAALVYNDSSGLMASLGLPAAHLAPQRVLLLPLVRQERLVAVLGVAGKPLDYDHQDIQAVTFLAGVAWELVVQKHTHEALEQTNAELQRFFDSALDLLCIADAGGHFRRLNREWENVLGYSLAELEGRRFLDLVHPDDQAATRQAIQTLAAQQPVLNFTNRYRCKDGTYRWLEWRAIPYGSTTLSTARDITQRIQAEAALHASSELLKQAQAIAHMGSFAWDLHSGQIDWSDEMSRILGVTPPPQGLDALSTSAVLAHVHPDDQEAVLGTMARLEQSAATTGEIEYRILRPNGEVRHVMTRARFERTPGGQMRLMTGVMQDITERKQMEQQLRAALGEKEALLQELHHRTKNNLQVVGALLSIQADQSQNAEVRAILLEMENRIRSMALVHQKLYRSHTLVDLDLGDYLSDLARRVMRSYQTADTPVDLQLRCEAVPVSVDTAIACGLIVTEIISNAMKYAFRPGLAGCISLGLRRQAGGRIALSVADNGRGTAPLRPHTLGQESSSLGMSIIYRIGGEQLGAKITLKTEGGYAWRIVFAEERE